MKSLQELGLPHLFLKPGELYLSKEPAIVSTVLGSCVSITFFAPNAGFASICHALLPSGSIEDGFKYVDSTLVYMVDKIKGHGIKLQSCEVKIFGGGDVLLPRTDNSNMLSIGQKNIAVALEMLSNLSIVPKASDVGGVHGRKLFFNTHNGDVFIKKVRKTL